MSFAGGALLIPSNSLAAVYGLARESAERQVLGADVIIDIDVIDESNTNWTEDAHSSRASASVPAKTRPDLT